MAPTPPTTLPKYLSVAELIESQIALGKWEGGRMPSVRGIASEHGISVVTASRALQVLRDKGLIQTIERSGCYRVPPPSAERWAICLHTTGGPWQKTTTALVRSGFESLSRRWPMHLDFETFNLKPGLQVEEAARLAAEAKAKGTGGLFLLPSRVSEEQSHVEKIFIQGCRQAKLPVVLLERNIFGQGAEHKLEYDLVTMDDVSGGFQATNHLFQNGRKRVGILITPTTSSHQDRLAGYLAALYKARHIEPKLTQAPEAVLRVTSPEDYSAIANQIVKQKLDGIVCYSDYAAIGVILDLLGRGIKVPDQIGVVGFDNLPMGDLFSRGITTYDYPAERLAEQAVLLIRDQTARAGRPPVRVIVPGEFIVRGSSVAPA